MKTLVTILFLSAVAITAATADPKAEQEVRAAMDVYKNAMLNKDAAALGRVLADDLVYTHSGGDLTETKADVVRSIGSGKSVVERLEFSDTLVRVYGRTAIVKGRVDLWHSTTNIVHMNVLHVFVKGANGWQMVARQATRLAK